MTKKEFQNWNPVEMGAIDTLLQNEREECLRIAERELTNCFLLNTSPPQSAIHVYSLFHPVFNFINNTKSGGRLRRASI